MFLCTSCTIAHACMYFSLSFPLPSYPTFFLSYSSSFPLSLSLSPSLSPQQKSVESIVATLRVLMESSVEELKIIQTILLLVTSTDVVQGKSLAKV